MATKSTIFKANVQIADIDHSYYADHALTLARHPSETDERMMVRLVALALNAHQLQSQLAGDGTLGFGAGLSNPDDPDVFLRDFTGRTRLWVEVGQPEEKPVIRACGKADEVLVYAFSHSAEIWWRGIEMGLTYGLIATLPSMWITFSSLSVSVGLVFTWLLYGVFQAIVVGIIFAKISP